jgi:hypothetical protein
MNGKAAMLKGFRQPSAGEFAVLSSKQRTSAAAEAVDH